MDLSHIVHAHAHAQAHTPAPAPGLADWADAPGPTKHLASSERSKPSSRCNAMNDGRSPLPLHRGSAIAQPLSRPDVPADPPILDLFAHQLVSTHFGGSGRHYEPMKPWSDTLSALRAGLPAEEALHGRIAYNCSHLRSYFAKVAVQAEGHDPNECLNACRGQTHKHGYICRFCKEHVSSDLHQMKYGPCIRHFRKRACVLPEDELDLFLAALDCVDEHYQRSSRQSEARHAERQTGRQAAGIGVKRSGSAKNRAEERGGNTSRNSSVGPGSPESTRSSPDACAAPGSTKVPEPAALDGSTTEARAILERRESQTPVSHSRSQRRMSSDVRYSPYITLWPSRPANSETRCIDVPLRSSTWPPPGPWPFASATYDQPDSFAPAYYEDETSAAAMLPSPFLPTEAQAQASGCWRRALPSKMTACTSYARTDLDPIPSPGLTHHCTSSGVGMPVS